MTRKSRSTAAQKRRLQQSGGPNRTLLLVGGVGAFLVVAAIVAFALASMPSGIAEPADSPIAVSGTPLAEYVTGEPDAAVGMVLPTLTGTDLTDAPLTIGPDGNAKAIVLLAHWCPHCQAEVPRLVEWLADNPVPAGVDVVGISTGIDPARPNYPPSAWLDAEGWTVPTLIDDAAFTAYTALGSLTFPGFVFVDTSGTVQGRTTGEIDPEQFGAILEQLAP